MKLKIEYLAPYFPYGLKVRIYSDSNSPIMDNEVYGYEYEHLLFIDGLAKLEYCKPILRPLSDLTKLGSNERWWRDKIALGITKLDYESIQELLEEHYDVFGLIEEGLAIDINTLKE